MEIQWPLLIFSVLLGATSGSFVFLAVGELRGKFREVRFSGALIALVCLAVGGCVSVLHMGHPERDASAGQPGIRAVEGVVRRRHHGIIALVYLVLAKKDRPGVSKVFGVLGGIVGLVLPFVAGSSYLIAARPAWDSIALPLMFLGAGLALGMTLMAGLVLLRGKAAEEGGFALKLALAGVVIMAVTTVAYVVWIAIAPYQAPTRSIDRLISGDLAVMFWAGVVVIGIVVPVALTVLACVQATKGAGDTGSVAPKQLAMYLLGACACTAIGAIVIRIIMYAVGTSVEQFIYH
ncbi:MAG: dimethyl sulfoxide reductase anchor subunit family protein [Eggerthella lenta]